jgi:hypothetical protein
LLSLEKCGSNLVSVLVGKTGAIRDIIFSNLGRRFCIARKAFLKIRWYVLSYRVPFIYLIVSKGSLMDRLAPFFERFSFASRFTA